MPDQYTKVNKRITKIRGEYYSETDVNSPLFSEKIVKIKGKKYREWDSRHSKLSAYMNLGDYPFPFSEDTDVLYLGASSGNTVSHISDICPDGSVFAVEYFPEPFLSLLNISEKKKNLFPILSDARFPEKYGFFIEKSPEVIYQDISQRDQTSIFLENLKYFNNWAYAFLVIKAISIDSTKPPDVVKNKQVEILRKEKLRIIKEVNISKYHRGHFIIVLKNTK
ncbi:fibrillarin-like rRNA/tRNA 2'-O-methyltransferase [Caldiplasma sukawensis]